MTDVFISYTRDERDRCVGIADRLRTLGLDVWFDAKLASGTSFDREIEQRVRTAKAILVLWSPKSVERDWVRSEATIGRQRDVLVSVEIAPCTLPVAFTNVHTEQLHNASFPDDEPAWVNVLARLAELTRHPNLASYRGRESVVAPRRTRVVLPAIAVLIAVGVAGAAAWTLRNERAPSTEEVSETTPTIDPAISTLANTLVGQWALSPGDCPGRTPGQSTDLTPSTGSWFTLRVSDTSIETTADGSTTQEKIVGIQNGWLRTFANGTDIFYRVDDAGRLLLRVGTGEPARLEPCI